MADNESTKIIVRRGPGIALPGKPTKMSPRTFTAPLEPGEPAFATDSGRIFIGADQTAPSSGKRLQYPYQNIEVIGENSTEVFSAAHGARMREGDGRDYYQSAMYPTNDLGETGEIIPPEPPEPPVVIPPEEQDPSEGDPTTNPNAWCWRVRYKVHGQNNNPDPYIPAGDVGYGGGAGWYRIFQPAIRSFGWETVTDFPVGTIAYGIIQFSPSSSDGDVVCFERHPEGGCLVTMEVQHWTMQDWVVVERRSHISLWPQDISWQLSYVALA